MSEHWGTPGAESSMVLPGYALISSFSREVRRHGGVLIFVKTDFVARVVPLKRFAAEIHMECCAIRFDCRGLTCVCVCVYRSPSGVFDEFVDRLSAVLDFLRTYDHVILCGDFNVNVNLNTLESRVADDVFKSYRLMGTRPNPPELLRVGMVLLRHQLSTTC